jgi:hypothetical protein
MLESLVVVVRALVTTASARAEPNRPIGLKVSCFAALYDTKKCSICR